MTFLIFTGSLFDLCNIILQKNAGVYTDQSFFIDIFFYSNIINMKYVSYKKGKL